MPQSQMGALCAASRRRRDKDRRLSRGRIQASRESASSRSTRLAKHPWVENRAGELLAARQRALHGWAAEKAGLATAPLKNARWERFAQHLAAGQKQTDAYLAPGYKAA